MVPLLPVEMFMLLGCADRPRGCKTLISRATGPRMR